jgi:hypothetical protein
MGAGTIIGLIVVIWVTSSAVAMPALLVARTHAWNYAETGTRTVCYLEWPKRLKLGDTTSDLV